MTNRIIKFRVWVRNEYMIYSGKDKELDYLEFCEDGTVVIGEGDGDLRYENIPLMQFTGLLDKNGREVFEGDILIRYKKNGVYNKKYYIETIFDRIGGEEFEVIGNIYENSDLLITEKE